MFHLNLKTGAAATPALNEVPWADVDAEENISPDSTPSTHSGDSPGNSTAATNAAAATTSQFPDQQQQVLTDQAPYPHCPIFIPTKGRSDMDRGTMATFIRDLVPFVLVVEKNEEKEYSALLDRLVGQTFGFAGMVYSSPTTTNTAARGAATSATESRNSSSTSPITAAATDALEAADLWDFPCACCTTTTIGYDHRTNSGSNSSPAVKALAQRLSSAFHHGYVFEPPTQADASGDKANTPPTTTEGEGEPASESKASPPRRATSPFILRDVEAIRALFRIEVLPESNRGVSYARNYILQVLVPQVMVGCGVDRTGNVEELCLSGPHEHHHLTPAALRSAGLEAEAYQALQDKTDVERYLDARRRRRTGNTTTAGAAATGTEGAHEKTDRPASPAVAGGGAAAGGVVRDTPRLLHGLFGFYWVLDDDIYGFYQLQASGQKQQRISSRAMLREVEGRLRQLRRSADLASPPPPPVPPAGFMVAASANGPASSSSSSSHFVAPLHSQQQQYLFTSKEDALANNFIAGGRGKLPCMQNYTYYYTTACFSLEYNRFALGSSPDSLAVNSYNNIACLFNYALVHNPPQIRYYPTGVPNVRRPEDALVGYLGHSMLWYRFAIREDYDFTLQLIARGLYTLRFRNLSFDVPQMMKVRGGMTDYYRNCHDEIRQQNDRFVLQWPAIAQHWVKGKDDMKRDDIRVRWDLLSPARAKHPGAFLYLTTPLPQLQPQRTAEDDAGVELSDEGTSEYADGGVGGEGRKRSRPASPLSNVNAGGRRVEAAAAPPPVTASLPVARDGLPSRAAPSTSSPSPASPSAAVSAVAAAGNAHGTRERRGGYVVERWRDINADEARQYVGLHALSNDSIHIGQTVAVIPPFFEQQPSVVLATVIERSMQEDNAGTGGQTVVWTAVAQDVRGMPFLHVQTCYRPPEEGIVKAAEKLDRFFADVKE